MGMNLVSQLFLIVSSLVAFEVMFYLKAPFCIIGTVLDYGVFTLNITY